MSSFSNSRPRLNQYFLPGDTINWQVIQTDICQYLGQDATVWPTIHQDGRHGFKIMALRTPTTHMLAEMKSNSAKYEKELSRRGTTLPYWGIASSRAWQQEVSEPLSDQSAVLRDYPGPRTDSFWTGTARSLPRVSPFVQKGKLFDLPMILNGVTVLTVPDTGSQINAITVSTLKNIKAHIDSRWGNTDDIVHVANDAPTGALCQVNLDCGFSLDEHYGRANLWNSDPTRYVFHVFATLASGVAAIMGRPFLETTETLTTYAHRLTERQLSSHHNPRCMSIGPLKPSGLRLKVYLDSELLSATPDTGSEIDPISKHCAERCGFQLQSLHRTENGQVEFANGNIGYLSGKIIAKFDSYQDAMPVQSFGRTKGLPLSEGLANYSPQNNYRMELDPPSVPEPEFEQYKVFYVLDDLKYDLILSQSFLHSIDAWNLHASSFENIEGEANRQALCTIFWYKGRQYQSEESISDCLQREQARISRVRQQRFALERAFRKHGDPTDLRNCQARRELTELDEKDKEDRSRHQAELAALRAR